MRQARAFFLLAALGLAVAFPLSAEPKEPEISGVYELGIGTGDALPLIEYLEQFGYRVGAKGLLEAADAKRLYGVDSLLSSIRLEHQDADHGLYRLMVWEKPLGEGLGLAPMKVLGGRWGAAVTSDVYTLLNHAEDAAKADQPILYVEPQRQVIYPMGEDHRPFLDPSPCVREMLIVRLQTRQILFERFGYTLPLYGRIAEEAPLATSQVTHAGLVLQGEAEVLDFYDQVLGLKRARDGHVSDDSDPASKAIFDLQPGERYVSTDFDDPRSDPNDLSKVRSGRLKVIRFLPGAEVPDLQDRSRPGHLGLSVYTYRVRDLEGYHRRVTAGGATDVTPILSNEFGEPSFSFVAPDGYFFTLIQRPLP